MKICVVGAGAMGGSLAALLARAGEEVTVLARGATLAAIRANGLTLTFKGETLTTHPACTGDTAAIGPQDYVIVALKAPAAPGMVPALQPLLGPQTAVVTAMNGLPWWYFHKLAGPFENRIVESVDPGGVQWLGLGPARAIGCVMWGGASVASPGVIHYSGRDLTPLGETDGTVTSRVEALAASFARAGLAAPVLPNIRDEIWMKLWGNLSFNPVSALTGATLGGIHADADQVMVVRRMMTEAQTIAEQLGVTFSMTLQDRVDAVKPLTGHKTSMLQDFESGRVPEIDALVAVVAELGRMVGVATPTIDVVLGLLRGRARVLGIAS